MDCSSCASFLPADKVKEVFGHDTDADVCLTHGHILSRPNESDDANERVRIAFATKCADYGEPKPDFVPTQPSMVVAMGDPILMASRATQDPIPANQRPTTCLGCKYLIPADVVKKELGWPLDMCRAKGRLMFRSMLMEEARNCVEGEKGPNCTSTDGPILLPDYMPAVVVSATPSKRHVDSLAPATDPREYESDRPLTAWDKENHILGWREVPDPEGLHESQYLPFFDWKAMGGPDAVDPRDTYVANNLHPELYLDHGGVMYEVVSELMHHGAVPLMSGAAGTGKNELAGSTAYQMDLPFSLLSLRDDTDVYEFVGETQLSDGNTYFKRGLFTTEFVAYGVLLLNEINTAPSGVFHYLREVLLGAPQLHIAQGNIYIKKHDWRFLMAAMNPEWDMRNIGTKPMAAADLERFSKIAMDYPPDNIERQIIRAHCLNENYEIPESTLDKIMQISVDLRALVASQTLPITWGIRPQIMVAQRTATYGLLKSYRIAVTNVLEPSIADLILDPVRSIA